MCPALALAGGPKVRSRPAPIWPIRDQATRAAVLDVHDHHPWWQNGASPAEALEAWIGEQFRLSCVAVSSGTTGLEIAMAALKIGLGDEVLIPASTFISTATAVTRCGATPVPIDVDEATLTLDLAAAEAALTSRTRAVVPVHLAGHPADMPAITAWARRHDLQVIEDSAQAVTASWDGQRVATTGDAAVLSFHEAKLLAGGSGGAVLLRDAAAAQRAEHLANNGRPRGSGRYDHQLTGTNGRIDVFSAVLVLARRDDSERLWRIRDRNRARMAAALTETGLTAADRGDLLVGPHPKVTRHDHYAVLVRLPAPLAERGVHAATAAAAMTAEGIPAKPLFPPWQTTPAYAGHPRARRTRTPQAAHAAATVIALAHPLFLDDEMPTDATDALSKLTGQAADLLRWQQDQDLAGSRADRE
jgi:3-amino-5-hydroxybenzoate synthase